MQRKGNTVKTTMLTLELLCVGNEISVVFYIIFLFLFYQTGVINSSTFHKAFQEWKYAQYEIHQLKAMDWMVCPPCAMHQHSGHVDGNLKLYRFKSAGR